jgi:HEPN domain-containing protein
MKMEQSEMFEKWHFLADNDLYWAEIAIEHCDWNHAAVHCQQALEKIAKGIHLLLLGTEAPRIHKIDQIVLLFEKCLSEPLNPERRRLFDNLSRFYIGGRYPDTKTDLQIKISEGEAKNLLEQSKEAFQWFLALKPQLKSTPAEPSSPSPKP